ncbi:MAG: hypothetical protein ACF8CQ_12810, partial [Rhodopirellula sp. JB044]
MMEFGKRLSWRLSGGVAAIALGALAAAQAQRQDINTAEDVPSLEAPAWAESLPMPIGAGPDESNGVMPAAFAANMPSTEPSDADGWGTASAASDAMSPVLVSQVSHEEPVDHGAAPGNDGPMAMPAPGGFNPAGMMGMPAESDYSEPADAPAMAMPTMGLPEQAGGPGQEPMAEPELPSSELPGPAGMGMPAMAMSQPGMPQPEMPQPGSEAPAEQPVATMSQLGMQEIQFEEGPGMGPGMGGGMGPGMNAGPDMNAGPGFAAGPMNDLRMSPPAEAHVDDSHAEPNMDSGPAMDAGPSMYGAGPMDAGVPVQGDAPMDMGGPVHPAPAAQGLVGDFGQPPAQTFGNNSLRQP